MSEVTKGLPRTVNRRTLVKGAAWSVPAIVVAGAAPAVAASPEIVFSHITLWRWYSNSAPWCEAGRDGLEINTTENTSTTGVKFTNTRSWTTITGVTATFWFARDGITWTDATGDSGCWTNPVRSGSSVNPGGGVPTMYPYVSTYTCPITPVHEGTTVLQPYRWQSQCFNEDSTLWETARWVRRQAFATVNGGSRSTDTGWFQIDSN